MYRDAGRRAGLSRSAEGPGPWAVTGSVRSPGAGPFMVLPKEQAVELANRAMDVLEKENRMRGEIDAGKTLAEVAYLQKWEKAR